MLQMLPEVISPPELLGHIALPEFVHILQVLGPRLPVFVRGPFAALTDKLAHSGEIQTTIAASVGFTRSGRAVVKSSLEACHG